MPEKQLRVGVVGASHKARWPKLSHIPAVKGLPGLRLAAVATRNAQSARESAEAFGADRWFADPFAMIRDEQVDIVTISVKVPEHRELVLAALDAGKAVYCEAPFGRSVEEAEELAGAVSLHHTAIGLQVRQNPAVRRAAALVSSGSIGQPLNAKVVAPTSAFGPEIPMADEIYNRQSSGANLLTITGGHTLDLVEAVLGPIVGIYARTEIRWPVVRLQETGEKRLRETADHINIVARTRSNALLTAEISGGVRPEDVRFSFKVKGSEGWVRLTSTHPFGVQAGDLKLTSNVAFAMPDEAAVYGGWMGSAINVGELYVHLARDIDAGTHSTPGFDHAAHNARLVEAVRRAAEQTRWQNLPSRGFGAALPAL